MDLSPEERKRIYEEEKARIEAEEEARKTEEIEQGVSATGLEPNVAGLLCYLGVWITGIVFLIIERNNRYVRFHAIQSIVVFGALSIANIFLAWIPYVGWLFGTAIGILGFVLWIVLMVKAYRGERYKVLWAGDLAEKA